MKGDPPQLSNSEEREFSPSFINFVNLWWVFDLWILKTVWWGGSEVITSSQQCWHFTLGKGALFVSLCPLSLDSGHCGYMEGPSEPGGASPLFSYSGAEEEQMWVGEQLLPPDFSYLVQETQPLWDSPSYSGVVLTVNLYQNHIHTFTKWRSSQVTLSGVGLCCDINM